MTSYKREDLESMNDEDFGFVYESVTQKPYSITKAKEDAISEIMASQTPKKSKMSVAQKIPSTPRKKPISKVRSTMKTPPQIAPVQAPVIRSPKSSVASSVSVVPETLARNILESEIIDETSMSSEGVGSSGSGSGSSGVRKRGRPRKSESLEKEKQKEREQKELEMMELSPSRSQLSMIDSIKKYAKNIKVLNPKATFQKPDVIIEREKEYITPIVVSDVNLASVVLPVQEEAKQTISEFLHSIGYTKSVVEEKEEEVVPSVSVPSVVVPSAPSKPASTKKKTASKKIPVVQSLDDEIEKLTKTIEDLEMTQLVRKKKIKKTAPVQETLIQQEEPVQEPTKEPSPPKTKKTKATRRPVVIEEVGAEQVVKAPSPPKSPGAVPVAPTISTLEGVKFSRKSPLKKTEIIETIKEKESVDDLVKSLEGLSFRKSPKRVSAQEQEKEQAKEQEKEKETEEISPETQKLLEKPLARRKPKRKEVKEQEEQEEKEPTPRRPVEVEKVTEEEIPEMTTVLKPSKPMVVKKSKVIKEVEESDEGEKEVVKKVEKQVEEIPKPASRPASRPASLLRQKPEEDEKIKSTLESLQIDRSRVSTQRGAKYYNLDELKEFLRQINKPITGKKEELAMRLMEIMNYYGF